jgi:hypothetical protein
VIQRKANSVRCSEKKRAASSRMTKAKPKERKSLEPSARVRAALEAMVFQGHHRKLAAKNAGLNDKSLFNALSKPHVKAFYNRLLVVLRDSTRAKNIHRLEAIRDRSGNHTAAVAAVKELERSASDTKTYEGVPRVPGLVVHLIAAAPPAPALSSPAAILIDGHARPIAETINASQD